MKLEKNKNYVFCGDNLEWLNQVPDESIDLCYIDPPFFSNRNYEVIWGNGYELRSFGDRFAGGVSHYIEWMRPRVALIHQKLKKTGVIFLHCDWHASHRLRCVLDDIFGEKNFVNEIQWKRVHTVKGNHGQGKMGLDPNVDSIFFYSKSEKFHFKQPFGNYSDEYLQKFYKYTEADGRKYRLISMIGPGGAAKGNPRYNVMGVTKYWRYSKEKMNELIKNGMVVQTKPGNVPQRKQYLEKGKGVAIQTLWDDIFFEKNEVLDYPTQKPKALIKRIIEMSCKPGSIVLDCFGGGGTTAQASVELGHTFIVGDVSPVACKLMSERMILQHPEIKFELKNLPQTVAELKDMNGHLFASTVCEVMGWKVNERKSGDGGIDGWAGHGYPIQIKNHSKSAAGRPDMQKFFGALAKEKTKKGIFVAWEFSRDALEFVADMKRDHKVEIVPMKCTEVFGALLIDSSKSKEIESLYLERRPKNWANNLAKAESHRNVIDKALKLKSKTGKKRKPEVEAS